MAMARGQTMAKRQSSELSDAPPWLQELRDCLPVDETIEIIVPTREGASHLKISRRDVDELVHGQQRDLKRYKRRLKQAAGAAAVVLVVLAGYSQDLVHEKQQLSAELSTTQANVLELSAALDEMFSTAGGVASGAVAPVDEEPLDGVRTVQTLLEDLDAAFTIYADITRQAVSQYQENLGDDLTALEVDPATVFEAASSDSTSWGGGIPDAQGPGRLLAHYVPQGLAADLQSVAAKESYRSSLPDLNPMEGGRMTSGFGMRKHPVSGHYVAHRGIDLVSWDDQRIRSAGAGRVVFADYDGPSGNRVAIDHGLGIETVYAHLARIDVEEGQWVERGEWIGLMGDTGLTDGAHLHYEVRLNDRHVDPIEVFRVAR